MPFEIETVRIFIENNSDPSYKSFSEKLLPQVRNIAGVRIPLMHHFVDTLLEQNDFFAEDLRQFEDYSFEEIMIEGLIIAKGPWSLSQRKKLVMSYIPKIKNWSHCDTFCKFIRDVDASYIPMIKKNAHMKGAYRQRFALVMLLEHFRSHEYLETILAITSSMNLSDYYAKMAAAWLLSMMYQSFPEAIKLYLIESDLDLWTKHKTIQKIKESLKTNPTEKKQLTQLKATWSAH